MDMETAVGKGRRNWGPFFSEAPDLAGRIVGVGVGAGGGVVPFSMDSMASSGLCTGGVVVVGGVVGVVVRSVD